MSPMPLVTIAIAAQQPYGFSRALRSALSQQYENLEVLVCDDSQGGEIRAMVEQIRAQSSVPVRYLANALPLGLGANLQQCVEQSRGEFIKILHDEDWLFDSNVSLLAKVLVDYPDVTVAASQRYLVDSSDRVLPTKVENAGFIFADTLLNGSDLLNLFEVNDTDLIGSLSNTLLRRAQVVPIIAALTIPGESFQVILDHMMVVCLLRKGNLVLLNQVLGAQRYEPLRISRLSDWQALKSREMSIARELLAARGGKSASAGNLDIRHIALLDMPVQESEREYEPLPLIRLMAVQQDTLMEYVGTYSRTYDEVYAQWLESKDFSSAQRAALPGRIEKWSSKAGFVVVVIDDQRACELQSTLHSLAAQSYAAVATLVLSVNCHAPEVVGNTLYVPLSSDWPTQLNQLLGEVDGYDWFYLLRAGDSLVEHALLLLAERIAERPHMQACYSDEDFLDGECYRDPVFKPDFNLDLLRSYPYVGRTLVFSREMFIELGGFSPGLSELSPHDLLWRIVECKGLQAIEHIAQVLVHCRQSYSQWLSLPDVSSQSAGLVSRHLNRMGLAHELLPGGFALVNRIRYAHGVQPIVSIVIVSQGRLSRLQNCLDSLMERTQYAAYEIVIVAAANESRQSRSWLQGIAALGSDQLSVVWADQVHDTLAKRINVGARQARGEYLLMLSQDCGVIDGSWLAEMMNHGQRSEVGIVGAKLFNQAGTVEHAGLIFGLGGVAGPAFKGEQPNSPGYMHRLSVVQNYGAVSGACLLVRKALFDKLGGLDEGLQQGVGVEVDLCLRAHEAGYLTVWTPYAKLLLRAAPANESTQVSAPDSIADTEKLTLTKWAPKLARDPAYNPNLTLGGTGFSLSATPRLGWQPFASSPVLRVLGLPVNKGAVGHYRLINPLTELERQGQVEGVLHYRTPQILEIERMAPDVIIFQGRYSAGPVEGMATIKASTRAFNVFELDDYLLDIPAQNEHKRYLSKDLRESLKKGVGLCDRLVVSTEPLADVMREMNQDIRVVPNMLAPQLWDGLQSLRRTTRKPRVGWGGGTSHTGDLMLIAEVVKQLAEEVDWVFFGMCPAQLLPYVHEFHPTVPLDLYPRKLASLNLDLALAPLEQHVFNDCKSNLRLLEYGACGYPVICSDTKAYRGNLPATRIAGNSTNEWVEAIRMHLADRDASDRMGDGLREAVMRDFVLRGDCLQQWLQAWRP
ncbi:glycosyltransferase [Pseudomonas sp. LS1212]|uniref:glycosyltransferase n=1 Tax=Pseudomonas sp. LS1212 TaxID=2972478 RepID=UPI00215C04C8|nr:glycosyltransferase [Pseudomonas sp. LS1212]UVJ45417.1 glycosyltransferase [Pseudomonas sp. LS1212]